MKIRYIGVWQGEINNPLCEEFGTILHRRKFVFNLAVHFTSFRLEHFNAWVSTLAKCNQFLITVIITGLQEIHEGNVNAND